MYSTRVSQLFLWFVFKPIFILLGIRFYDKTGELKKPYFIVMNHCTMWDFMLGPAVFSFTKYSSLLPLAYMTKNKLMDIFLVGHWIKLNGGFRASSSEKSSKYGIEEASRMFRMKRNVIIFPEGRIIRNFDDKNYTLRSGIKVLADRHLGARVVPMHIILKKPSRIRGATVVAGKPFDVKGLTKEEIMARVYSLEP